MSILNISEQQQQLIRQGIATTWLNNAYGDATSALQKPDIADIHQANDRLIRFAPLLQQLFPELEKSAGIIESPLHIAQSLNKAVNPLGGALYLKMDNDLPVAGSIKARGGIYEVLCFVEELAIQHTLIENINDNYSVLASSHARDIFSQYSISVGSTGNLGLSIGITAAAFGFNTIVHMSCDAKAWKKAKLRSHGVTVIEHDDDYGAAVEAGRLTAEQSVNSYFIDDERSPRLFMGYAVAALRLEQQLKGQNITVDAKHPLFVYLPAGVGGAPGGITFGLKAVFDNNVHCFFAEPVQAPCMLLGMAGAVNSKPCSVYNFGLKIDTDADGLAVGTASQWVCDTIRDLLSGVFTATDDQLYQQLLNLKTLENIKVEPSAAISCLGPTKLHALFNTDLSKDVLVKHLGTDQLNVLANSTHIAWLTGGSLVPDDEYAQYLAKAHI
jgi:D-serine dehydratase